MKPEPASESFELAARTNAEFFEMIERIRRDGGVVTSTHLGCLGVLIRYRMPRRGDPPLPGWIPECDLIPTTIFERLFSRRRR